MAGAPTEFFDRTQMDMFCSAWNVESFDGYLEALVTKKTSPNGVFGFKALYGQLADAFKGGDPVSAFPNLQFVYVRRRDRVRQAVSFAIAMQTEQWASDHAAPEREPLFDPQQIQDLLDWIYRDEGLWEQFFERNEIQPLRLVYEDFVASVESSVLDVLRYLSIEVPAEIRIGPPTLLKQADERTERWVARFLELDRAS